MSFKTQGLYREIKQKSNYNTDLKQRSYKFSIDLIEFVDKIPKNFSTDVLVKQLIRSGTSIGANIIEAHGASSRKDFANFLGHALKSANETKYWLGLLRDTNRADKNNVEKLLHEAIELASILAASLITIRGKNTF